MLVLTAFRHYRRTFLPPKRHADLIANKRPVRQILAHEPKLLLEKDLKDVEGLRVSDCLLGASLNGDRFNACGISEDTLL